MSLSIQREMTISEAHATMRSLDFLSRLGIGQIDEVADLVRDDSVQCLRDGKLDPTSADESRLVEAIVQRAEHAFDYPYGASYGIGHKYVSPVAHRAWEMKKVMDKTLSLHREPNPSFPGVNYDGVTLKYTRDPTPEASVSGSDSNPVVKIKMTPEQLAVMNQAIELRLSLMAGDFQAITRLAEAGILIPYDKQDLLGKPVHSGRPEASPEQLHEFGSLMSAVGSSLGFKEPIDLGEVEIPSHFKAALSAKAVIQGDTYAKPEGPGM